MSVKTLSYIKEDLKKELKETLLGSNHRTLHK